jgi:hypothetical protein
VVRYAKSYPACEIENSEDLKLQLLAERTISLHAASFFKNEPNAALFTNPIFTLKRR